MSEQPPGNPYGDQPPPFGGGYAGGPPIPQQVPQVAQPQQYATPLAAATAGAQPGWAPAGPSYAPVSREPGKRPGTITAAGIVTIVFSALTALGSGLGVLGLLVARDDVLDRIRDDPSLDAYSSDQIITAGVVVMAVLLVWSLAAVVIAVLAMRRSSVSRILLVVSAAGTILFSLLAILSVVSLVTLVAGIAVIVLLFTGGANQWYAGTVAGPQVPPPLG